MKRRLPWMALLLGLSAVAGPWPSWRGPTQDNTSPETKFPLTWSTNRNVKWRVALPAPGNSSPIVWGDQVFVTQATEDGHRRALLCFHRADGRLLWERSVRRDADDPHHDTNPHCAASPVTDGRRVVASFGSAGIVAWSLDGRELWRADLGPQQHQWGQGSSPVLHGDSVLVYHGPGKTSALYALDAATGAIRWKTELPEEPPQERFDGFAGKSDGALGSFSTPLVIRHAGREQVILPVANRLRSFAPADGRELWSVQGMNPLVYTSATYGENTVVAMGGFFGSVIFARPDGAGDVTATHRTFYEQRAKKHRIGSPLIHEGHVYLAATEGFAQCLELATGRMLWEERLKSSGADPATWGSMVRAGDRLYVQNHSGDTLVLRASPRFEVLATNPLGELSNSTPALSDGEIFLRTHQALYCVGETKAAAN